MVNYNMGRYYAWSNLSKYIRSTYRKHFYTPQYRFTYIQPKVHTSHQFIPFEEWKANKLRNESLSKHTILGIAVTFFFIAKFVYQVLEDEDKGYYHHVNFPILSQSIVWIAADVAELTKPFFEIMPKDRYEVTQIYPRLFELVFNRKGAVEEEDRKALELRKAIEEYDKTHN